MACSYVCRITYTVTCKSAHRYTEKWWWMYTWLSFFSFRKWLIVFFPSLKRTRAAWQWKATSEKRKLVQISCDIMAVNIQHTCLSCWPSGIALYQQMPKRREANSVCWWLNTHSLFRRHYHIFLNVLVPVMVPFSFPLLLLVSVHIKCSWRYQGLFSRLCCHSFLLSMKNNIHRLPDLQDPSQRTWSLNLFLCHSLFCCSFIMPELSVFISEQALH